MPTKAEKRVSERVLAAGARLEQRYVEALPIDSVVEHPANPNEGDIGALHEMIDANGFYGAIIVQEKTPEGEKRMRIIAGNHRHRTMMQKGKHVIPAFLCVMDDERALKILLGDNRARDKASTNDDTLARTLQALNAHTGNTRGTGYDTDDLQDLLKRLSFKAKATAAHSKDAPDNPYLNPEKSEAPSWPVIKIRVPPELLDRFTALMDHPDYSHDGTKPWQKLEAIIDQMETTF